jgi:predicted metal-dependent HD superfamily phosphohydrolase
VMLSVGMAILGQDDEVYLAYAQAIRCEYGHVPDAVFLPRRRQALSDLRDRARAGQMFGDRYFAEHYNDKAIDNLTREIDTLGAA